MIGRFVPRLLVAWLLSYSTHSLCQGGPVVEMDDIEYWVGAGSNRSALAIDWSDQSSTDPALVWGYRWDGSATGAEMLTAIIVADRRLFAKLNQPEPADYSSLLYGLGYDASNDGQFALDDATMFDTDGIAVTGAADGAKSVDREDFYAEGWFIGLWHYGVNDPDLSSSNPYDDGGGWISSLDGMFSRELTDGSWDSWTFTPPPFDFEAFAENPHAAEAPVTPGDFEPDSDVDGADFLTWQRGFGITSDATLGQGDANGDEMVDGVDLNLWQANYGSMANTAAPVWAVPEPSAAKLAILLLFYCFPAFRRNKKSYEVATMARIVCVGNGCDAWFCESRGSTVCG